MAQTPEQSGTSPSSTAASRYEQLTLDRAQYLRRAEEAARVTIPSLIIPEGSDGSDLYKPYQSVGARGVNNLANKLLLALFPPGSSFFRLTVDNIVLAEMAEEAAAQGHNFEDVRSEFEAALAEVESAVVTRMEQRGIRTTLFEALKHLLVTGSVVVQVLDNGGARLHPLNRFVVKRDKSGNVLEIIIKETVSRKALPKEIQEYLEVNPDSAVGESTKEDEVDIYTRVQRGDNEWTIHQEAGGEIIPGTEGTDPLDKPSFLALRRTKIDGEDYSRGFVEEYIGDLLSLEALNQAIVEFSGAAAKILIFVNEAGTTSKESVARARSGEVLDGDSRDISVFQLEKYADFRVANEVANRIEQRLEQAFMLMSSVQRHAERVTAEEIRVMANELEQSLGGLYSILAQELQRPLVDRVMLALQKSDDLPALPESVQPQIVAGLEGLSRSSDLTKYQVFFAAAGSVPDSIAEYVNFSVYLKLLAASLGIEAKGLVRSEEEVQEARQAAQRAQMVQTLAPHAMKAAAEQEPTIE